VEGRVVAVVERPKPFALTDLSVEVALGGPVFTSGGKVIGVLSELGDAGPSFAAGFAAESDARATGLILDGETIAKLVKQPPRTGETRRAWLGITLQALERDMAEYWHLDATSGIIVNSVVVGSPAAAAGLQAGDIILTMNGAPVPVSRDEHVPIFIEQVGSSAVGSSLRLGVMRDGERLEATVDLAAAPKTRLEAEKYENDEFEITVRELVFQDQRAYDLEPGFRGVVVTKVEEGGWAGVGGLSAGDLVQKVDDQTIASPTDLRRVLEDATRQRRRKLVFFVQRAGKTQFVTVQPHWEGQS
jgi:serine protease Do